MDEETKLNEAAGLARWIADLTLAESQRMGGLLFDAERDPDSSKPDLDAILEAHDEERRAMLTTLIKENPLDAAGIRRRHAIQVAVTERVRAFYGVRV